MYSEIIVFYSENHKNTSKPNSGQNAEVFNIKRGGKYSNHWYYNVI